MSFSKYLHYSNHIFCSSFDLLQYFNIQLSPYLHLNEFLFVLPQDELQEKYNLTGHFPGPTLSPPRRPWALLNWLFWIWLLLLPLCLLLLQLFHSGSAFTIFTTAVLCFAGTEVVILKLKHMLNDIQSEITIKS